MKVHFIAIGGSVMHNLAITLQQKGYTVSGSDDEIYDPATSRLRKFGIMPAEEGWFPDKIDQSLDAVILGMHARRDNPELQRAKELGIPIYSYPEFIYQQSLHKERVVVGGSHGKTTTTSMIMHVLKTLGRKFDYLVGATSEGFDTTVRLSEDAPVIIIEGDEYLTSPDDPTPKFFHYHHHIGLITGIAWDHINVYPDFAKYVQLFDDFIKRTPKAGTLIYCGEEDLTSKLGRAVKKSESLNIIDYPTHKHKIVNGQTFLITEFGDIPMMVFGKHNMQNLNGAKEVCNRLAVTDEEFYQAIRTFKGASKRLELLGKNDQSIIYRDFAHAPSKVQATISAAKDQYPKRKLVICAELHTFSSLNKNFLPHYKGSTQAADLAIVYYNPKTVAHKKLEAISEDEIIKAFGNPKLKVCIDSAELKEFLLSMDWKDRNLLLMSSGTFDNMDLKGLADSILN
jgi:UDP-N-acetylmuramate: L-alanyl-gamma-D-glutamyl-meso-diaminopimelate ligase